MEDDQDTDEDLNHELPPGSGIDEDETIESLERINDPFDPTLIRVERSNPTINLVTRRIENKEINLSPDFQRKGGIWTEEAQSRLIESILIRIPLPAFYVDATNEDYWLVVDGLQRLTTLRRFIVDEEFSLRGLEFLHHLEGMTFSNLPRSFQRRIEETEITIFLIQAGTPEEVKFNIFKRINTGGLPLSAQEIRNALNGVRVRGFINKLAISNHFKRATRHGIRDKRMADKECVTRFLAFRITDPEKYSANDFDSFLNKAMANLNDKESLPDEKLDQLETDFYNGMDRALAVLGKHAFRKYHGPGYRLSPINKALFETWSVNLASLSEQESLNLERKNAHVMMEFADLMGDSEFSQSISAGTGSAKRVKQRFAMIRDLIERVLAND